MMTKNNKGMATLTIVLIIVAVVVLIGGTIGGIMGYNAYQEKKQQEEEEAFLKSIEESRTNAVNSYNDRINQIMVSLNVEKDGTSSIDNNEDVDAMTNAVNELNNIVNDINDDVVITQEQKDTLKGTISSNIDIINNRINAVNVAKAEAEAARIEAEKYNRVGSKVAGSGYGSWQKAYISYIENPSKKDDKSQYELVYIDDDEQPELWVQGSYSGAGEQVLTYDAKSDQLKEIRLVRIGSSYIPKTGLICDDLGVSGTNPISIFELHNGDFYLIGEGMVAEIDGSQAVELRYEWEGKSCSEEELYRHKNELYNKNKSVYPNDLKSKGAILSELRSR